MDRLSILAEFNNSKDEKSAQALLTRGNNIFGPEELDTQMSANFLIILLDCIEKWALTFQFEDSNNSNQENKYYKAYQSLIDKGVKFPSTFKQTKKEQKIGTGASIPSLSLNSSQFASSISQAALQDVSDQVSEQSSRSNIVTPDKKGLINNLKKKMQKVKEHAKNAKSYLEQNYEQSPEAIMI